MTGMRSHVPSTGLRWLALACALLALAAGVLATASAARAAQPAADVVFVIDESSSMGDEIADVKARIGGLVAGLDAQFDDRYALVAFGGAAPGQPVEEAFTRTNLTTGGGFSTALAESGSFPVPGGASEKSVQATAYALRNVTGYRAGAGVCVVLVTDEASSYVVSRAADIADAAEALASRNAAFFAITDTSVAEIRATLGPDAGSLAALTGGAVFELSAFRADAAPVLQALAERCATTVQERASAASFTAVPTTGVAPLPVTFTAAPVDGASYAWDFGDGSTGSGAQAAHTYAQPGAYTATLTVTVGSETATATTTIRARTEAEGEPGSLATDCTISGTAARDVLVGTGGPDVICGFGANDRLRGLAGNDVLVGGAGNDLLKGGPGADRLLGGTGADLLRGQRGGDRLSGDRGRDRLLGGLGNDTLLGGQGRDVLVGGAGRDALAGDAGPDELQARDGRRDTVDGGTGRDRALVDALDVVRLVP